MDLVLAFYQLSVALKQHINSGVDDGIFKN